MIKFLIDEDLPRSANDVFKRYGYESLDGRDIGLRGSTDAEIAAYAVANDLCLVTGDFDFADIRNYQPSKYPGIIALALPVNATAAYITVLLDSFIKQPELVGRLKGRLAIVEPGRVRWRSD